MTLGTTCAHRRPDFSAATHPSSGTFEDIIAIDPERREGVVRFDEEELARDRERFREVFLVGGFERCYQPDSS